MSSHLRQGWRQQQMRLPVATSGLGDKALMALTFFHPCLDLCATSWLRTGRTGVQLGCRTCVSQTLAFVFSSSCTFRDLQWEYEVDHCPLHLKMQQHMSFARPFASYLPIDFQSEIDRIVCSTRDSGRLPTGQAFVERTVHRLSKQTKWRPVTVASMEAAQ